jgi:hypothetical protein
MRFMVPLLLLAGCAAQPAPPVVVVEVPRAALVPPPAQDHKAVVVVKEYRKHLAEVGRYAVWDHSKPPITRRLGTLAANAGAAVRLLQDAPTARDKALALPAAVAAVDALKTYLQTKGD